MEELNYPHPSIRPNGNNDSNYVKPKFFICPTCLSKDRDLYVLNGPQKCVLTFLGLKEDQQLSLHNEWLGNIHQEANYRSSRLETQNIQQICWECYAIIRNILRFKNTALQAQKFLKQEEMLMPNTLKSLSTLKKTTIYKVLSINYLEDCDEPETKVSIIKHNYILPLKPHSLKHNEAVSLVAKEPAENTAKNLKPVNINHRSLLAHHKTLLEELNKDVFKKYLASSATKKKLITEIASPVSTNPNFETNIETDIRFCKVNVSEITEDNLVKNYFLPAVDLSESSYNDVNVSGTDLILLEDSLATNQSATRSEKSKDASLDTSDPSTVDSEVCETAVSTLNGCKVTYPSVLEMFDLLIDLKYSETAEIKQDDSLVRNRSIIPQETLDSLHLDVNSKANKSVQDDAMVIDQSVIPSRQLLIERKHSETVETSDINPKVLNDRATIEIDPAIVNNSKSTETLSVDSTLTKECVIKQTSDSTKLETESDSDVKDSTKCETVLKYCAVLDKCRIRLRKTNVTTLEKQKRICKKKKSKMLNVLPEVLITGITKLTLDATDETLSDIASTPKTDTIEHPGMEIETAVAPDQLTENFLPVTEGIVDKLLDRSKEAPSELGQLNINEGVSRGIATKPKTDAVEHPIMEPVYGQLSQIVQPMTETVVDKLQNISAKALSKMFRFKFETETKSALGDSDNSTEVVETPVVSDQAADKVLITEDVEDKLQHMSDETLSAISSDESTISNDLDTLLCAEELNDLEHVDDAIYESNNPNISEVLQKKDEKDLLKTTFVVPSTTRTFEVDNLRTYHRKPETNTKPKVTGDIPMLSNDKTKIYLKKNENPMSNNNDAEINLSQHEGKLKGVKPLIVNRIVAHGPTNVSSKNERRHFSTYPSHIYNKKVTHYNKTLSLQTLKNVLLDHSYFIYASVTYREVCHKIDPPKKIPKGVKTKKTTDTVQAIKKRATRSNKNENATKMTGLDNEQDKCTNVLKQPPESSVNEGVRLDSNKDNLHQDIPTTEIREPQSTSKVKCNSNNIEKEKGNISNEMILMTDIKEENYIPDTIEEYLQSNREIDSTISRCKIESEEVDIKSEPLPEESNATDSSSESDYRESNLNYTKHPPDSNLSKLSYYDYLYRPLGYGNSPNDDEVLEHDSNITSNADLASGDFDMGNIVVSFANPLFYPQPTDSIDVQTDSKRSPSPDARSPTPELLQPVYYTNWTDCTYEHQDVHQNKTPKKKKSTDQTKTDLVTVKKEPSDQQCDQDQKRAARKRPRSSGSNQDNSESKLSKKQYVSKTLRISQSAIEANDSIIDGIDYEKLLLRPVVTLENIDRVLKRNGTKITPDLFTGIKVELNETEETISENQIEKEPQGIKEETVDIELDVTTPTQETLTTTLKQTEDIEVKGKKDRGKNKSPTDNVLHTLRRLRKGELEKMREKEKNSEKFKMASHKCESCVRVFKKKQFLQSHIARKHAEVLGPHKCAICETRFKLSYKLKTHMWTHRSCHQCRWCENEYLNKEDLRNHVGDNHPMEFAKRTNRERTYTCEICSKKYLKYTSMYLHRRAKHASPDTNFKELKRKTPLNKSSLTGNNSNLTENNSELIGNNSNLTENNSNLTENNSELTGNNSDLTENNSNLTVNNSNSTENKSSFTGNKSNATGKKSNSTGNKSNLTGNNSNLTEDNSNLTENKSNLTGNNSILTKNNPLTDFLSNLTEYDWSVEEYQLRNETNNSSVAEKKSTLTENKSENKSLTESNCLSESAGDDWSIDTYDLKRRSNNSSLTEKKPVEMENNSSMVQNYVSLSQNNSNLKKNNSSLSKTHWSLPQNSSSSMKNNSSLLKKHWSSPQNNSSLTENNPSLPENNSSLPENDSSLPENNSYLPGNCSSFTENNNTHPVCNRLSRKSKNTKTKRKKTK